MPPTTTPTASGTAARIEHLEQEVERLDRCIAELLAKRFDLSGTNRLRERGYHTLAEVHERLIDR